jgi:hypothetical protein
MLNACAISGAGKEEFITLEQNAKAPVKEGLIVSMSCPEKVYSIMAFILVPLPPIIPVFWANEKISRLYITAPNIGHPEVEITSPTGELVKVMVTAKNESQNHNNPDSKDYFFHINKDCSELNGHMISVSVGEKKTSFYIRYTEGKVKFEWAYLSA